MNIIVKTSSSKYIVRPDTTWERDNEDFFPPEFVDSLSYTPVLFARISKPGRSVSEKFASRYYDGVGYGLLLYPENMLGPAEEDFACASCLDHTSFLPFPTYLPIVLGGDDNLFRLFKDGSLLYETAEGTREMIENAISEASKYIYFRSGDILAIELKSREFLCRREEGIVDVAAMFCKNKTIEFKINF